MRLSADGVISLMLDDEFGLSEAESDEEEKQESDTDIFAFMGSPTVISEEVEALDDVVSGSS